MNVIFHSLKFLCTPALNCRFVSPVLQSNGIICFSFKYLFSMHLPQNASASLNPGKGEFPRFIGGSSQYFLNLDMCLYFSSLGS